MRESSSCSPDKIFFCRKSLQKFILAINNCLSKYVLCGMNEVVNYKKNNKNVEASNKIRHRSISTCKADLRSVIPLSPLKQQTTKDNRQWCSKVDFYSKSQYLNSPKAQKPNLRLTLVVLWYVISA